MGVQPGTLQTKNTIMKNLLTNLIKTLKNKKQDDVPYGWFTKEQIAKEMDISISQVKYFIFVGKQDGKITAKKFKLLNKAGSLRNVTHYANK
jgi:hypothetical protein